MSSAEGHDGGASDERNDDGRGNVPPDGPRAVDILAEGVEGDWAPTTRLQIIKVCEGFQGATIGADGCSCVFGVVAIHPMAIKCKPPSVRVHRGGNDL